MIMSSEKKGWYISFFQNLIPSLHLACLVTLTRTPSTVLNRSDENRYPCLVLDPKGKSSYLSASSICRFGFSSNLGKHQLLSPWMFFSFTSFSSAPGDSSDTNVKSFVSQVSEALFFLFKSNFLCFSDWVISTILSSNSLILSYVISSFLLSLSSEIFFSFKFWFLY